MDGDDANLSAPPILGLLISMNASKLINGRQQRRRNTPDRTAGRRAGVDRQVMERKIRNEIGCVTDGDGVRATRA